MGALAHPRHELLAQKRIAGLARGEPQVAAYKAAGYRGTGHGACVNASRMLNRTDVARRIAELQDAQARKSLTSTECIAAQLDADRALAHQHGQAAAAVASSMAKAKLFGLVISRHERAQHSPPQTTQEVLDALVS